jgi:hypothetical protein
MATGMVTAFGIVRERDVAKRNAIIGEVGAISGTAFADVTGRTAAGINTTGVWRARIGSVLALVDVRTADVFARARGISVSGKTGLALTGKASRGVVANGVRGAGRGRTLALVDIGAAFPVAGKSTITLASVAALGIVTRGVSIAAVGAFRALIHVLAF